MRKLKLLLAACALFGVSAAWAQTDVTNTYLTNTDFSGTYSEVAATPTAVSNDRKIYQPNGWNIDLVNNSANNMTVIKNGDPQQSSNFKDTYAPGDGKYMVRFRDNQTSEYIELSQNITITEAGLYFLSADLIRENSSKAIVELFAGTQKVGNSQDGAWETRYLLLNVSANQEIKIGVKFSNKGAGGHKAGADNIKLEKLGNAPVDVTNLVYNPNFNSDIKGWSAPSGGPKLANNKTDQTTNFYETWNSDPKQGRMYQVLEGLPQGTYQLKVFAFADQKGTMTPLNTDVCVYAQGQEVGTSSSSHIHRNYVNNTNFAYYKTWAYVDATGKLEIGMRQDVATFRWLGMDNVTLQYVSSDDQEDALLLTELQTKWNSIITDWNDNVLNGATYVNIKGAERATFASEMATATAASITTIADYKTNAKADLVNAYLTFINPDVKTSYDNLAAAITAAEAAGVDATAAKAVRDAAETTAAAAQNAATLLNNTVKVKNATTTVPVVTDFVTNGTFDENVNGWTATGEFQNSQLKDATSGTLNKFWENWNPSAKVNKMYQTINNIPNGTYRLDISAFASKIDGDNSYVFANNDKTSLTNDATTGADYQVYTVVTNNTIEIGLEQTTATAEWMGIDNVSLRYYGAGDVVNEAKFGSHKYDYDQALDAATNALADANYTNVTGSERATLQTEVEKTEPTTTDGYDQATLDLTTKTSTFVQAKGNYDDLVAEIAKAKALGIAEATANGYAAIASSTAATALTSTQNLKVAEYNYVKTNYPKDFTTHFLATPTTSNFGTNKGQHWDGNSETTYFDSWNGSAVSKELTYTIKLPEGRYIIMAAGRGQANSPSTLYISDGTNNEYFTMKGDTGLGINKKGATSFDPDDAEGFANTTGRGWEWRYLLLELTGEETEVTLSLKGDINNSWVGACNFTLLTTADNIAINKAAYKTALAAAEAARDDDSYKNVIGSEKTELLAAIATDVSANTEQVYDDAAAALESATTTFKAAKASYDALAAINTTIEGLTLPYADAGKKPSSSVTATSAADADTKTASQTTALRKYYESNALAEGVTGAENKTSLIKDPNMDVTYDGTNHTFGAWQVIGQTNGNIQLLSGESFTDGDGNANYKYADIWKADNNAGIQQTINLEQGKYMLTVTARANTTAGAAFRVFAGGETADIERIGNSGGVFDRGWNDASVEFTVNETSDVTIGVQSGNGKDLWWSATRFRLVKLPATEIEIAENAASAPATSDFANVTLERTFNAGWNAVCLPFATAAFNDADIYEFTGEDAVGDNVTLNFSSAASFAANTPYLVYFPNAVASGKTFNGVAVAPAEVSVSKTAFEFKGVYAVTDIDAGNWVISGGELKKASAVISLKPTRTYFAPKASTARIAGFTLDGGVATGLKAMMAQQGVAVDGIYNLKGQKVSGQLKKGIYVVEGKKVVK